MLEKQSKLLLADSRTNSCREMMLLELYMDFQSLAGMATIGQGAPELPSKWLQRNQWQHLHLCAS